MHFQGQKEKTCKGPAGTGCHCDDAPQSQSTQPAAAAAARLPGKVLYGSQKGTAASFANQLVRQAATFGVELQAVDLETYEVEQLWKEHLVLLVLSTYENGSAPDSARYKSMFAADISMACLAFCQKQMSLHLFDIWLDGPELLERNQAAALWPSLLSCNFIHQITLMQRM